MFADLHLHSTASDGADPPAQVVRRAARAGFSAIALADHDTVDGLAEAGEESVRIGIELIPAVEYSTLDGEREIHMLGYGVDVADPVLVAGLARLRAGRFGRARVASHFLTLAKRHRLLVTGGSDDHGGNADEPLMGRVRLPYSYVDALKAEITQSRAARAPAMGMP